MHCLVKGRLVHFIRFIVDCTAVDHYNRAMKIAVKCPNWVGDVVMATAALQSVRASFPDDVICAVVRPDHRELLEGASFIDELICMDEVGAGVVSTGMALREHAFDAAIILPRSYRAALLMRFSGAPRRVGFASPGKSLLLTEKVEYKPRINTRDMYLRVCRASGCGEIVEELSLPVVPACEKRAEELISGISGRPVVGLVPGGAFGSAKLWPVEHFGAAAAIIRQRADARFVVLHGPGEGNVARQTAEVTGAEATICEGLGVLKSVVKRLDLLLTNDTGPRHIGVAFSVPTVVLMGPTRDEYTDYPAQNLIIVREQVDCGPCQLKLCPEDHRCMIGLSPEKVADKCLECLKK